MTDQKEVLTEVTSIAKEEQLTGKKVQLPTPEEIVARASAALINDRRMFIEVIGNMSKKATIRTLNAIFDLPSEGIPVKLVQDEEKFAFTLGQRIQNNRFLVIQQHIMEQRKLFKAQQEAEEAKKAQENSSQTSSEGEQK